MIVVGDWIYGIVAVMVFGTVILQVIPEETCQKYVRLFLGTLLILAVTGPVCSLFDLTEENRLRFEQELVSSWMGMTLFANKQEKNIWKDGWQEVDEWQKVDRWETLMQKQMDQKQEAWLQQVLVSTAEEYGYVYLSHEVQWNQVGDWPVQLMMWVKKTEDQTIESAVDGKDSSTENHVQIAEGDLVEQVASVGRNASDMVSDTLSSTYYEPSELRPLHYALQVVWQLKEEQIILYCQR